MDNKPPIGFEKQTADALAYQGKDKGPNKFSLAAQNALEGAKATLPDFKNDITKTIAQNVVNEWKRFCTERRAEKNKKDAFRKGPAPIEDAESLKKAVNKATYGTLDSDVEDLEFEDDRALNGEAGAQHSTIRRGERAKTNQKGNSLASCRALIVYFSKLAKTRDEDEVIDLNFVASLLQSGADINFSDRHGQCILHEISRAWHPDVAKFAIQNGADVNKADSFGRTPLHLAAAVDYAEMVEFLIQNGGMTHDPLMLDSHFNRL